MTQIVEGNGIELQLSADLFCWNRNVLQEFADTAQVAGNIACQGCVQNPAVGNICTAQLETSVSLVPRDEPLGDIAAVPGFRLLEPAA